MSTYSANPRPRRHRRQPSPQWSETDLLRQQLRDAQAEKTRILEALPEVARVIAQRATAAATQAGADAAVRQLAERGLLRQEPAKVGVIKTLVRDEHGTLTGLIEQPAQIEPDE